MIAGAAIFLFTVLRCWTSQVEAHEMIYLLGSRRLADPGFLAADFTWATLSPTTALFDHMIAPLWARFPEFAIVNAGRVLTWAMLAASLAFLARTLRIPAWSVFAGFVVWLLWGQTLAECGSPLEGFQPKSFAYPLVFASLAFALRGQSLWAGACAGLATAFHVIVGGWGLLAVLATMLASPLRRTPREFAKFLAAAAPFVAPLLFFVATFHGGHATAAEAALMDRIYVTFAMPHCCDLDFFMGTVEWARAGILFPITAILVYAWHEERAQMLGGFVVALIVFFALGTLSQRAELYSVLKLYPGQLASGIVPLLYFVFVAAWIGQAPQRRFGWAGAVLFLAPTLWFVMEREAWYDAMEMTGEFRVQVARRPWPAPPENEPLYRWIREQTPRDAVFVTPFLAEFWPRAERAQVASIRHMPLDRRLIEWRARLEALNGFHPIPERGFDAVAGLDAAEAALSREDLARLRERYGATHYVVRGERPDLAARPLHAANGFAVYALAGKPE